MVDRTRRQFLGAVGAVGAAGAVAWTGAASLVPAAISRAGQPGQGSARKAPAASPTTREGAPKPADADEGKKAAPEVSPGEDLMREHGVLRRVLLVYDEAVRRLQGMADVPPAALYSAASIVRRVIEDYHEKLEEQHLFPRFEKAGRLTDLVKELRAQHEAGRRLTDTVLQMTSEAGREKASRRALAEALHGFIRMYRPHAAREDTVLFPAFHELVGEQEYRRLGDAFEDREREVLGEGGFEKAVAEVARAEESFGISDLSRFTPT